MKMRGKKINRTKNCENNQTQWKRIKKHMWMNDKKKSSQINNLKSLIQSTHTHTQQRKKEKSSINIKIKNRIGRPKKIENERNE